MATSESTAQRSYGDVYLSDNAGAILGDLWQIIHNHDETLSRDVQDFAEENLDLVNQFITRMHALQTSLDGDNRAKSRALQNIGEETERLKDKMKQYESRLREAHQQPVTGNNPKANFKILHIMCQTLEEALNALESSLRTFKDEADRHEKQKVLRELDESRANVQNIVAAGNDAISLVVKVPVNNPNLQKTQGHLGTVSQNFGLGSRMVGYINKLRGSKDKVDDAPQTHTTTSRTGGTYYSAPSRMDTSSYNLDRVHSAPSRPETNYTYEDGDRPEDRPVLPLRPGRGSAGQQDFGNRWSDHTSQQPVQRPAILGDGWQPPRVGFLPPPMRTVARPSDAFKPATTYATPTSPLLPIRPERPPQEPPRPGAVRRTVSEVAQPVTSRNRPQEQHPEHAAQRPAISPPISSGRPPPPSPKPSHLSSRTTSPLMSSPPRSIPYSPRSSGTISISPTSPTSSASSTILCYSPPQKPVATLIVTDMDDLMFAQKRDVVAGLVTVQIQKPSV